MTTLKDPVPAALQNDDLHELSVYTRPDLVEFAHNSMLGHINGHFIKDHIAIADPGSATFGSITNLATSMIQGKGLSFKLPSWSHPRKHVFKQQLQAAEAVCIGCDWSL